MSDLFTKDRPIAKSLLPGEIWNDIPAKVATAMGGEEFFFDEEARAIHRVGIGLGLGWRLPKYKQRKDRINHITVSVSRKNGLLVMQFFHSTEHPEDGGELIDSRPNLQYADLKSVYQEVMYGEG